MRTDVTRGLAKMPRTAYLAAMVAALSLGVLVLAGGQGNAAEPDAETAAFEEELSGSEPDAEPVPAVPSRG